mmetsp:Transcript_23774/g.67661  ORF Transcript_23774/g.67661 Transcript_23774/m.67661 type:complete len:681 (-) Transcript_23774:3-2045(-)
MRRDAQQREVLQHGAAGRVHDDAAAVLRDGHQGRRRGAAASEVPGLEEGRPGHSDLVHGHGCGGLGNAERAGLGEALQVGEQRAQLHRDILDVSREGLQATLHSAGVDAPGRPCEDAAGAHLHGLVVAGLGGAVARVAGVVRHAQSVEERGVRGALVHHLDGEAERHPDPCDDQGNEADLHIHPCRRLTLLPEGAVHVGALVRRGGAGDPRGRLDAGLRLPELAHNVVLAVLELLRRSDEPNGMLEGARELPLARPPGGARALRDRGRILRWRADPEKLHRVDDVDGVGNVDKHEADGLSLLGEPTLVFDGSGEVGEPEPERAQAVDGEAGGDDVEREDHLLQNEHRQHHEAASEQGAVLLKLMPDLQVRPAVRQVHEGQENAEAGVDVVREPLVLDLPVGLEVLRRGPPSVEGQHGTDGLHRVDIVHGLLLLIPCWHVVAVARALLGGVVHRHALVEAALLAWARLAVPRKGHAEDLLQRLLLEAGEELARLVHHALIRDRQTHEPGEHVRRRGVRAHGRMHREPQREAQEEVAARDVHKGQTHEPAGGRRRVKADAPRAIDGGENREPHRCDAMVAILAGHCQLRHLLDVGLVLAHLRDRHVQAAIEPGPMRLLVEHVVAPVVREQAHAHAAGGRRRCRSHLHGCFAERRGRRSRAISRAESGGDVGGGNAARATVAA